MSDGKICDLSLKQNILEGCKCFDIDIISPQSGDRFAGNDVDVVISFSGDDNGGGVWYAINSFSVMHPVCWWSRVTDFIFSLIFFPVGMQFFSG
jgi:hypothetical protein